MSYDPPEELWEEDLEPQGPFTPDQPLPPDPLGPALDLADQIGNTIANVERAINSDPGASPPPELPKADPAVSEAVVEPIKKCTIESVLPGTVVNLIKVAPQNDTVRAVILAHLNLTIPPECVSYAQIKKWIEFNYVPPVILELDVPPPTPASNTRTAPQIQPGILISFTADEEEIGSARYSVSHSGSGQMAISERDIIYAAQEAETWEELFTDLYQLMNENISEHVNWQDVPENQLVERGYRYSSHEVSDSDNFGWNWDEYALRQQLGVLLQRLAPDILAYLNENE